MKMVNNFVKTFKNLPRKTRQLLSIGTILALLAGLPLFVWAIVTQRFDIRKDASRGPGCERQAPALGSPRVRLAGHPGDKVSWSVVLVNNDSSLCGDTTFNINIEKPDNWILGFNPPPSAPQQGIFEVKSVKLSPGQQYVFYPTITSPTENYTLGDQTISINVSSSDAPIQTNQVLSSTATPTPPEHYPDCTPRPSSCESGSMIITLDPNAGCYIYSCEVDTSPYEKPESTPTPIPTSPSTPSPATPISDSTPGPDSDTFRIIHNTTFALTYSLIDPVLPLPSEGPVYTTPTPVSSTPGPISVCSSPRSTPFPCEGTIVTQILEGHCPYYYCDVSSAPAPSMCGGIAGIACPVGEACIYGTAGRTEYGPYPDQSGTCQPIVSKEVLDRPFNFKLRLGGVDGAQAEGAYATFKFVSGPQVLTSDPIKLIHKGNGEYSALFRPTFQNLLTKRGPNGDGYTIYVKGEKHLANKFCFESGQVGNCAGQGDISIPDPEQTAEPTFVFTGHPLEPGDLTPQDGKAGASDFITVKTLMGKLCSKLTAEEKQTADLDYNGCVNIRDAFLLRKTLETKYDEF